MVEAECEEYFVDMEGKTFEGEVVAEWFNDLYKRRYWRKEWIEHLLGIGGLAKVRRLWDLVNVISMRQA